MARKWLKLSLCNTPGKGSDRVRRGLRGNRGVQGEGANGRRDTIHRLPAMRARLPVSVCVPVPRIWRKRCRGFIEGLRDVFSTLLSN